MRSYPYPIPVNDFTPRVYLKKKTNKGNNEKGTCHKIE